MWMDNWVLYLPVAQWPLYRQHGLPVLFRCFASCASVVVLSSSNKASEEAHEDVCAQHGVPILQRKGGGGTVILGPGCLILTLAFYAKDLFQNQLYFQAINDLWIEALQPHVPQTLSQAGISDLCVGDRKVGGTSIFRKKHLLVYQGSILVDPSFEGFSQFLKHPSREPAYRQGRSHKDFLTSLSQLGCTLSTEDLAVHCQTHFNQYALKHFQLLVHPTGSFFHDNKTRGI